MTEIPEHLLRRSRERRAALGLAKAGEQGGGPGTELPAAAEAEPGGPATGSDAPARAETSNEVAPAALAAVPAVGEEPAPSHIAPRGSHKTQVPLWVMPVLIALPLWAFLYPNAFTSHKKAAVTDPLVIGQQVYTSAGCSGCHGANGEGGLAGHAPALHGGQSKLTFPSIQDQINWVKNGSQSLPQGRKYGDPNRAGGQHMVNENPGDMPAFGSSLSPTQIQDVVQFERERL